MKKDFLLTKKGKNSEGGDANNGIYQVLPAAELLKGNYTTQQDKKKFMVQCLEMT
jgi:hypothetical protein